MLRTTLFLCAGAALLVGCPPSGSGGGDDDDTEPQLPQPAALAEPSDGECPDLSSPGVEVFSSGGTDRKVVTAFPEGETEGLPIIFFFHGLTTPDQNPAEQMANALDLQELAEDLPAIIVIPEAPATVMPLVGEVSIWGILGDPTADLTLYDDLRACVVNELGGDIRRVTSAGFSGGALWTAQMLMSRADTLAAAVSFSGGVEFELPIDGSPFLTYQTPAEKVPTLLVAGGETDEWPQGFGLIDFVSTTDTLQGGLRVDGHFLARCDHDAGHTITNQAWGFGQDWAMAHEYGIESPFATDGIGDQESWCEVVE
ncbi:MAG: hypothetical protein KDA24_05530 [Deltaproteobacteria bacterium]|nr:hypothetical protein [Deltaproteobacteria bacterium]